MGESVVTSRDRGVFDDTDGGRVRTGRDGTPERGGTGGDGGETSGVLGGGHRVIVKWWCVECYKG